MLHEATIHLPAYAVRGLLNGEAMANQAWADQYVRGVLVDAEYRPWGRGQRAHLTAPVIALVYLAEYLDSLANDVTGDLRTFERFGFTPAQAGELVDSMARQGIQP